ncbi:MAG: type II secretion system protein GspK [Geminicoccaceae bacterium]
MRHLSPAAPPADGERGIALVAVLWFVVTISALAVTFSALARGEAFRTRNMVDSIKARVALETALDRAVQELLVPTIRPGPDGVRAVWAIEDAEIGIRISGESGRIDINAADDRLLESLLRELGVDRERARDLADAIVDWRDTNTQRQAHGAEDAEYRRAGRPEGAADAPFTNVAELRYVLGMTPEIFEAMRPWVTVSTGLGTPKGPFAGEPVRRAVAGSAQGPSGLDDGGDAGDEGDVPSPSADMVSEDIASPPPGRGRGQTADAPDGGGGPADQAGEEQPPAREGIDDPQKVYGLKLDIRLRDGYEAHADAVVWLEETADGRPYRLLAWEPAPLRVEERP